MKEMNKTKPGDWLPGKMVGCLLTALFLLMGTSSFAQEIETVSVTAEDEFNEWDVNDDGQWTEDEFGTAFDDAGVYNEWDLDDDSYLNNDELGKGIFDIYDANDDGYFDEDEFTTWNTVWGGDYDYGAWDVNDDELLDYNDFDAGINEYGVFNAWDAGDDGLFTADEITTGFYDTWDADNNDYLDLNEYETYGYGLW